MARLHRPLGAARVLLHGADQRRPQRGAAFAGGLVLDDPDRYAGAAICCGTLPFDAGLSTDPGRLALLSMFVPQA